jgi:cytochrome bd-type quinol oxidase subunit 2
MRPEGDPLSAVASGSSNHAEKTIRQPWLNIFRAAWLVAALAALLVLGLSVPGYIQAGLQGASPDGLTGAPVSIVSAIKVASVLISFLLPLLCLALAGLLFWRKSEHGMSLFVAFFLLDYGIILAGPIEMLESLLPGAHDLTNALLFELVSGVLFV